MEKILKLLSNKNLIIFVLLVVIAIIIMLYASKCSSEKQLEQQIKQNTEALKKDITVEKNKNKELQYSVVAYEGKISDIGKYSADLEKEVAALKNRKPIYITKVTSTYNNSDTAVKIPNKLIKLKDDIYELTWEYFNSDSSRILKGKSDFFASIIRKDTTYKLDILPGETRITNDMLKLDFVVGLVHNKKTDLDEIFVTPKNPDITIGKLEGFVVEKPKEKSISIGFNLGYGIIYTGSNLTFAPYIGIGLNKKILNIW